MLFSDLVERSGHSVFSSFSFAFRELSDTINTIFIEYLKTAIQNSVYINREIHNLNFILLFIYPIYFKRINRVNLVNNSWTNFE